MALAGALMIHEHVLVVKGQETDFLALDLILIKLSGAFKMVTSVFSNSIPTC